MLSWKRSTQWYASSRSSGLYPNHLSDFTSQQEKNSGRNRPSDHQNQYNSGPVYSQPQQQYQQPYGLQQNPQQQHQHQQQQQPGGAGGGAVDPYAAYGGYENYLALWYSSYQAQNQGQQQQQQHQQSQNAPQAHQGPPGS